jgi:hypothetical protein
MPLGFAALQPPRSRSMTGDPPVNRRSVIAGDRGCLNVVSPFDLHEGFHGLTRSF